MKWVAPEYLAIKPKLRILILGDYKPSCLNRLKALRDHLIRRGYSQSRLVLDFSSPARTAEETEEHYNLRKSRYWISRADIFVFLFFAGAKNQGTVYELKEVIDRSPDKVWRSIVGISAKPAASLSSLIRGELEVYRGVNYQYFFTTRKDLCEGVEGQLPNFLERLYPEITARPLGEWELSINNMGSYP